MSAARLDPMALATPRPTRVTCPYCHQPVAGLLAGCQRPVCVAQSLAEEMVHVRRDDR